MNIKITVDVDGNSVERTYWKGTPDEIYSKSWGSDIDEMFETILNSNNPIK